MAKSENSREVNCGPLSLLRVSGMPCLANTDLSVLMIVWEVVDLSWITSDREK